MSAITFPRFRREALDLYKPPFRAKSTRDKVRQVLDELEAAGVRKTSDLNAPRIAKWLSGRSEGRRPATLLCLLRTLRALTRYAVHRGYLRADPFDWRPPSAWIGHQAEGEETEPFDRHRSAAEIRRLLALADAEAAGGDWRAGRLRALVYLLAFTGMRRREALGMRAADVDLPALILAIRSNERRPLKTRRSGQPLAIAGPLAGALAGWLPRAESPWLFPGSTRKGPWLSGGPGVRAYDQLRALGERAGLPGLTFLDFRHTFATLSEGWHVGELELQRWLRHTTRGTQRAYRKADREQLLGIAGRIRFDRPAPAPHPG